MTPRQAFQQDGEERVAPRSGGAWVISVHMLCLRPPGKKYGCRGS